MNDDQTLNESKTSTSIAQLNDNVKNAIEENDNATCIKLAKSLLVDIDDFAVNEFTDGHRRHLGASLIGHECARYRWLVFRWCKAEEFDGRLLRLFQRGHREENAFVQYLEGIGCEVIQFDPTADPSLPKSKRQIKVSAVNGHFGGSVDGIIKLPEKYGIDEHILVEFKTQKTGGQFAALCKNGVRVENYRHFVQMNVYMHLLGLKHALYLVVNKNDDSLHAEIITPEYGLGESVIQQATDTIIATDAPPKHRKSPAQVPCVYCNFKNICHFGEEPEKNCRSCKHAYAGENKTWVCRGWGTVIPNSAIPNGCNNWEPIINGD